ncbi:MAG: FMN-binding protein [Burkholderiales bacterium]|nr:FMN-binding protein [Burkholderiales bacterium]
MLAGLPAHATQYATADEAAKRSFPQATSFRDTTIQLTPQDMRAIAAGAGVPARSAQWHVLVAMNADKPIGVVVLDGVIGKFELIDYAVAIDPDGKVRNVEILSYRESHGYEIRLPAWRKQFVGKDKTAPLRVGDDIANISGATMSCEHVTDGVRRIVAVVSVLRAAGKL